MGPGSERRPQHTRAGHCIPTRARGPPRKSWCGKDTSFHGRPWFQRLPTKLRHNVHPGRTLEGGFQNKEPPGRRWCCGPLEPDRGSRKQYRAGATRQHLPSTQRVSCQVSRRPRKEPTKTAAAPGELRAAALNDRTPGVGLSVRSASTTSTARLAGSLGVLEGVGRR